MKLYWIAGALLVGAVSGCGEPRHGFLARLQQDCQSGDQDACGLLAGPAMAPGLPPQVLAAPPARTAVQHDVEAIMQGMDRSRAESRNRMIPDEGN